MTHMTALAIFLTLLLLRKQVHANVLTVEGLMSLHASPEHRLRVARSYRLLPRVGFLALATLTTISVHVLARNQITSLLGPPVGPEVNGVTAFWTGGHLPHYVAFAVQVTHKHGRSAGPAVAGGDGVTYCEVDRQSN